MTSQDHTAQPILFFDGECNLCNSAVQFVIRHDRKNLFLFASLQSAAGREVKQWFLTNNKNLPDSIILKLDGRYYTQSAAALHTARLLGGSLSLLYSFIIVPSFLRNAVYNLVARNRYKWFGKRSECMVPTPQLQNRFLD